MSDCTAVFAVAFIKGQDGMMPDLIFSLGIPETLQHSTGVKPGVLLGDA